MNLSIFNSNIFKILIIFISLFIGYNFYLYIKQPEVTIYQNQWQGNMVFAQDFIYGTKSDTIIVGSSMAARLERSFLPKDIYNISFGGGSALTGLEILRKLDFTPKTIYVETNIIFRTKDKKMIDNLFIPVCMVENKILYPSFTRKISAT